MTNVKQRYIIKLFINDKQKKEIKEVKKMQKQMIGIRMDKETIKKIDILAKNNGRNRSNQINFIIKKFLEMQN